MRSIFVLLFLVASAAAAEDVLGPAEYLAILAESKLHYNILSTPSKTPIEELRCPRRDESTRLVIEGDKKKLVAWTVKLEALKLMNEGETLFQARDYAGATEKYKAAIAADPQAPSGYYFYGDALLFGSKDAAAALAQYEKGIALDPTQPLGHFFASTALVQLERPDEAREHVIKALTYYPSYQSLWKVAASSSERWNVKPVVRHKFEPPAGYLGKGVKGTDIYAGADNQWLGYAMCKAVWASEPQFAKRRTAGGWSLEEERACVLNQMMAQHNKGAHTPLDQHLVDVLQAHLLDGYILFEIIGQHCPIGLSVLDDEAIRQIDGYIRKYVIVAAK